MRKFYFSFLILLSAVVSYSEAIGQCSQNFDGVTAPALPSGWSAVTNISCTGTAAWVTTTSSFDNAPNAAFTNNPACISDEYLLSESFPISSSSAQLSFRRSNNLENTFDGLVLEISIGGGAFQDIITAGGSFVTGGYNAAISVNFGSPIAGRQAWTGNSAGFVTTTINLPASANGQNVVFRFRRATDSSIGATGAFIDNITITGCTTATAPCSENFDGVTVPSLPTGWTATVGATCATTARWVTSGTSSTSAPNAAFVNDPSCVSDEYLDSRSFPIISPTAQLVFQRSNNLENGFDGMVLEISINGGAFQDIIAAGGSFVTGGYNGTISVNFGSPIGGRQAWTGNSGGFVTTTVNLPASANGQSVVLRFRRASDSSIGATGAFIDDLSISGSACGAAPPCSGTPNAGTITGPATACAGTTVALALNGHSTGTGISYQWKSSAVSGGPYTNIVGANGPTYTFTSTGTTRYYIATVRCSGSGIETNTSEFEVIQSAPTHTVYSSTITSECSPGAVNISGTVSGGALGGYGVIGNSGVVNLNIPDNNPTGVTSTLYVANGNIPAAADLKVRITARHSWVGDLKFTLTSPCGTTFLFDRPGVPPSTVGNSSNLGTTNATTPPPGTYTFDIAGATVIPETSVASGFIAPGTYQPSDASGAAHNWAGLTFPCNGVGNWQLTITDAAGGDQGALVSWQIIGPSVYTHTLTGPGTITQTPSTGTNGNTGNFTVTNLPSGTHSFVLTSFDGINCPATTTISNIVIKPTPVITFSPAAPVICAGQIQAITANVVPATPVVFSPVTGLFTDPAATIPYTGSPINVVYAKPASTTLYTASANLAGCSSTATVNVTVNPLPAITVQPAPATQTLCPGFTATYSVTATGPGLTYQWRRNGVALVNNAQTTGATSNTLTIIALTSANTGTYDVVVSGTCPPAVTSNAVTLNVATTPVISAQPLNRTVCEGLPSVFTVATAGSVPAPTIFQWQVSTDGGVTWVNLLTDGSFTSTYTIPAVTNAMNNNRYRVIVTNSCGQTVTSAAAVLTVTPKTIVTANALTAKICISDTLVNLTGSPVGGSWSGVGVSGFAFIPTATAVGTYTLTYTYTNAGGCVSTATTTAKVEDCQERLRLLRDDALILFPNPNNGRFNVRINSTLYNYIGMKVYNTQGQLVNGTSVNDVLVSPSYGGLVYGRVIPIDLTNLPAGIYMVKFYYDDGVRTAEKTFKVIVGAH